MSYQMRWMLRVEPEGAPELASLSWPGNANAPTLRELLGEGGAVWSWYGFEDEMRELSARFPPLLFVLTAHNAEEPGLYPPTRYFFHAGASYSVDATIAFPEFDASKLA